MSDTNLSKLCLKAFFKGTIILFDKKKNVLLTEIEHEIEIESHKRKKIELMNSQTTFCWVMDINFRTVSYNKSLLFEL